MKKKHGFISVAILSVIGLCLISLLISALANLTLPKHSDTVEVLSDADKSRLAESWYLLHELGDDVWPGWGQTDIPMIVYNEAYAFLVGYPNPPDGWVKVPAGVQHGGVWDLVAEDDLIGGQYYRQRLSDVTPEAFTVMVGRQWVCSLPTFDWMGISLTQNIREDLPSIIQPVFPYRLFIRQLVSGDDQYISLSAHECFHAYQGMMAADKFAVAENASAQYEGEYPWEKETFQADWKMELALLAEALQATDPSQNLEFVRQFLELRASRRTSAGLSSELIAYEQKREWLEGLARYAELETWRLASITNYMPLLGTNVLPHFEHYANFENRWSRELAQFQLMADDEGDGRFYYSGMAQAYLLDRLSPGWKTAASVKDIWLDDLLQAVVVNHE